MSRRDLLRHNRRLIREQCFREMIQTEPIGAVRYLQSELYSLFDHTNPEESNKVSQVFSISSN